MTTHWLDTSRPETDELLRRTWHISPYLATSPHLSPFQASFCADPGRLAVAAARDMRGADGLPISFFTRTHLPFQVLMGAGQTLNFGIYAAIGRRASCLFVVD